MIDQSLEKTLALEGFSRRDFLKFCSLTASILALPQAFAPRIAEAIESNNRPSVIWLSMQECTGCTESLTRSHAPTIEDLILDKISLDYHHTLQAAAGDSAEKCREDSMHQNKGKYILLVDGSIPNGDNGYSTIAGISNYTMLKESAKDAAAIVSIGSCASFGGLPNADPNPTNAVSVDQIITDKPIINVPGCPPIPIVITAVLVHYFVFEKLPELDAYKRPKTFFGRTIHDGCPRRPFYDRGQFAETFDDEGAKKGWCLFKLGCKGPTTYNSCVTSKWNQGTSFPIESGHGCLGCSESKFWDAGSFYEALSEPRVNLTKPIAIGLGVGAAAGLSAAGINKMRKKKAEENHYEVTLKDMED